ncbi:hypothetical protein CW745_00105 [Psychromonas sp. psych-6C06]|nr:hypothetical protein CW745_00105 [Psychromonas sp. psych-6C06]
MGIVKPLKKDKKGKSKKKVVSLKKLLKSGHPSLEIASLQTPIKSKPCKSCPALKKGLCKCALKRLK